MNPAPNSEKKRPSRARKPKPTSGPPAVRSALERFEVIQIHRSQCKGAPYNPRTITPSAKRKLRAAIKKVGLLGPITWNRRSGNIVGGHQRIDISDQLMGTKDYNLTVAAVDLTDAQEREANLLLNNAAAQGDFDLGKLEVLLKFPGMDLESTGWDSADVMRLFGAVDSSSSEASAAAEEAAEGAREEMKKYDEAIAKARERDSDDFYMCVIFRSYADRKAFTAAHGLEDNRYQSADDIAALLTVSEPGKVPDAELPADRNRRGKRARPPQLKGKTPSTEIAPIAERPNV